MKDIKKLGELVDKTVKIVSLKMKASKGLSEKWTAIADKDILDHTRVKGMQRDILHVKVDSAVWLHYIVAFKKEELLRSVQKEYKKRHISDIRFYIGQ